MNILIFSQHFYPESFRINDIALDLQKKIDNVYVLTGKPNYPSGNIFPGYNLFGIQKEKYNSITIFRVPLIPRGNGGVFRLLLNYISFLINSFILSPFLLRKLKIDIIFIYGTSPLIQGLSAIPLKYIFNAKLITWVQDLWPEDLSSTGYIKNKFLLKINEFPVKILYYFSDKIFVQSNSFLNPVKRLTNNKKIFVVPNPAESNAFLKHNLIDIPRLKTIMSGKFNIVFAGNIGNNQSIKTIIEAAELIKYKNNIQILMVGSGSYSQKLDDAIKRRMLKNLVAVGRFDIELMPFIFQSADALLVTLGANENLSWTVPCKIQSYMAAGKPIIGSINGEGKLAIDLSNSGLTANAEDPIGLAKCIICLSEMKNDDRVAMGNAGRKFAETNYHPHKISQLILEHFRDSLTYRN